MIKTISTIILLVVILNLPLKASGGSAGLTFLKFDVSSRIAAMGGAATALSHETPLMHYNPAGIAAMPYTEVQLMHQSWIQDMSLQYGGIAIARGRATFGISVVNSMIEGIEVRTQPGPPQTTFTARNFAMGSTFAYRISPSFRVGASAKLLYEKFFVDEAYGYAFDLGIIFQSSTPGLFFGFSILNVGKMSTLREESTRLPLTYRIGTSYELPLFLTDITIRLAADALRYDSTDKLYLMFGGEIEYSKFLFARVGYTSGINARGMSTGFGIKYNVFKIDYAFIPLQADLGTAHSISLGIIFN